MAREAPIVTCGFQSLLCSRWMTHACLCSKFCAVVKWAEALGEEHVSVLDEHGYWRGSGLPGLQDCHTAWLRV